MAFRNEYKYASGSKKPRHQVIVTHDSENEHRRERNDGVGTCHGKKITPCDYSNDADAVMGYRNVATATATATVTTE